MPWALRRTYTSARDPSGSVTNGRTSMLARREGAMAGMLGAHPAQRPMKVRHAEFVDVNEQQTQPRFRRARMNQAPWRKGMLDLRAGYWAGDSTRSSIPFT